MLADALQHLDAVELRHHQVEDDDVVVAVSDLVLDVRRIAQRLDVVAVASRAASACSRRWRDRRRRSGSGRRGRRWAQVPPVKAGPLRPLSNCSDTTITCFGSTEGARKTARA